MSVDKCDDCGNQTLFKCGGQIDTVDKLSALTTSFCSASLDHIYVHDSLQHCTKDADLVLYCFTGPNPNWLDKRTAQPAEYYRQFLKQDVRPDGRELGEIRSTILNLGSITTAEGSALVKLGNTTVICGIKAEFTTPKPEEPKQGFVVPNVELPPLCSSRFKPGPPSTHAQVVSQLVADIIESAKVVDLETLCIQEEKLCWVLFCDLMCLDYDGNIADACLIALIAALKNVKLPSVSIDSDTGLAVVSDTTTNALDVKANPVATTFAIFDDTILIADPTNEEECLATGMVTMVINEDNQLCTVHKPGGSPLSAEQLQDCINRAITRANEVRQLIDETGNTVER